MEGLSGWRSRVELVPAAPLGYKERLCVQWKRERQTYICDEEGKINKTKEKAREIVAMCLYYSGCRS